MSFRYNKRIDLGEGAGINVSKSGLSYSQRTKYGSIGSRGFSIKTGIPGLTFRNQWKKGGSGLAIYLVLGGILISILIIYNFFRFLGYVISLMRNKIRSKGK